MSLFKRFMQFAIGNGVVLIIGFLSSPIITRIINPSEMGKFSMFNTIVNLLLLLVLLGLDQSYVRFYYEENESSRKKLLKRCIILPLLINIVLGIFILIFYKPISLYIVEEQSLFLGVLLIIHLAASIISRFALLQVRMKQRAKLYSILNVIMKLSYLILIGLFYILFKDNYMTLIMATIFSNIIMSLLAIIIEAKEWFCTKDNIKLKTRTRELVKYGIPFIFSMAITWVFQSIDRIAIKGICGYEEVGLYSGAMTIIALLNTCQAAFTTFWVPVAYENYSKDPNNKQFFSKVNKIVVIVMLLVAIALITAKDIIILLLDEDYRQAAFIFPYLVFMPIMYTISETTVLGINFKKKTKNHIYIAIISALFNIIGNIVLVPKYGAIGAAVSTGLSYIVFFSIRTYISQRYYKVNYNLGRFTIATIFTYILAAYSSFNKFNRVILIISICTIFLIILLYKEIFIEFVHLVKERIKKIK